MHRPLYTCTRSPRPLELTGKLTDPLWQTAETARLTDAVTGQPCTLTTTARLLYTATHLYVAFHCEDDYVWGTLTEHDSAIYTEECVEVFISPSGKMRQYYEINVSPLNTVFDAFILNGGTPGGPRNMIGFHEYTCAGLETAVCVDGELGVHGGARGWSAEYAIPFSALIGADDLAPSTGDAWLMNLYRIDAQAPERQTFLAWACVDRIDFHQPWLFGTLRFG